MAVFISGFDEQNKRISTQQLLQKIYAALDQGETEFEILASGHHDIGGPLWTKDGSPLKFTVKNPGQRVGAFGLEGTEIVVDGPAPADVGWLAIGAGSFVFLGARVGEGEPKELAIPSELSEGLVGQDAFPAVYRALTAPFFASLTQPGPTPSPNFADGLAVQKVIDAVARSVKSEKWEAI